MEKVTDIKKVLEKNKTKEADTNNQHSLDKKNCAKATNPIFKKLMQFKNEHLTKKFDINDLLR